MSTIELFFTGIRKGDLQGLESLLKDDPKFLMSKDERGSTPLILASYYNHKSIVGFLIEKGVPIDEKDASGNTCLLYTSPSPRDS